MMVDHIGDVDILCRKHVSDLTHHGGYILICDKNAGASVPGHIRRREIYGISDVSVLQEAPELVDGHDSAVGFRLWCRGPQVGNGDDLVVSQQCLVGEIGDKARYLSLAKGVEQILCVDKALPRKVHKPNTLLHDDKL